MNKKDLISSFESLTPSDYQKQKMLNNVLSSGMEKTVHKVSFNFRYMFSTAAAAMCVLAVVVAVGPMYKYHKLSQNPSQKVTFTDKTDDITDSKPVVEDTATTDIALPEKAVENKSSENDVESTYNTEAKAEAEPVITAEAPVAEDSVPYANGRMLAIALEEDAIKAYTPQLNINHKAETNVRYAPEVPAASGATGGGGGSGYVVSDAILDKRDETTSVSYKSDFDIPEGFSATTSKSGNQQTFRYVNGSSYIYIKSTNNTYYVSQMLKGGYLTTDVNGTTAVVFENGKEYTAYIISNDIAYTIDTYDVSEEDLANLLLSIAG